ncbi:MAG: hypothetical protein RL563_2089 [Pseudomonadota bacterium]|jgi:hypothetical protein
MFTIHSITGEIFSGTLEEMEKIDGFKKIKPITANAYEGD